MRAAECFQPPQLLCSILNSPFRLCRALLNLTFRICPSLSARLPTDRLRALLSRLLKTLFTLRQARAGMWASFQTLCSALFLHLLQALFIRKTNLKRALLSAVLQVRFAWRLSVFRSMISSFILSIIILWIKRRFSECIR